jgi:CrcB protein
MDWREALVDMRGVLLVAAGGAVGCVARFGVSTAFPTRDFPWATLLVNIVGAFVLGFLILPAGMDKNARLLVGVGLLGGFTTLSTFSVEVVDLARTGRSMMAGAALLANGLGGPLAAFIGWRAAVLVGYPS